MQKNNYHIQKSIATLLIVVVGVNYLILLVLATIKISDGFLMQIIFLLDSITSITNFKELIVLPDFYLNFFVGISVVVLWAKFFSGIINIVSSLLKTRSFLTSLKISTVGEEYTTINSKKPYSFTSGVFRPRVYLSNSLIKKLTRQEVESVKQHELYHAKSYDPARGVVVDFIKRILPPFPKKSSLFQSYDVLSELSADLYAEGKLNTKKHVISALSKVFTLSKNPHINLSPFGLNNERIPILVGKNYFKTKSFFTVFFMLAFVLTANTYLIYKANIFMECRHLGECFATLFSGSSKIYAQDKQMCMASDNFSPVQHCVDFTDSHIF